MFLNRIIINKKGTEMTKEWTYKDFEKSIKLSASMNCTFRNYSGSSLNVIEAEKFLNKFFKENENLNFSIRLTMTCINFIYDGKGKLIRDY